MSTVLEIRNAIERLTSDERQSLSDWLLGWDEDTHQVREPAAAYKVATKLLSVEEYLEFEMASDVRHEYVYGVLYAMSGVSRQHHDIASNLFVALHGHLRGGPCRPYITDFKVRLEINNADILYYPDVMVACGTDGVDHDYFLSNPKLIVEVLSPSTEKIDRREKRLNYLQIRTLEEYVLVSQRKLEITSYRRSDQWSPQVIVGLESAMDFRSIGLSVPLAQIYEDVEIHA